MSSWEETLKRLKGSLKERPRRTQEQREKDFEEFVKTVIK